MLNNLESSKEVRKNYREKNKDKLSEINREWRKNNKGKCSATKKKYKIAKNQAIPSWPNRR